MALSTLLNLADRQYGVFSTSQAQDLGISRQRLSEFVRRGLIERIHWGVYRPLGAPLGYEGELLAACLAGGPDSVVSHRSAARLWRLGSLPPGPPEVMSPRWKRLRSLGLEAHESNLLEATDRTTLEGFPVLTPLRTLFVLGAVEPDRVVAQCLDDATSRGLVTLRQVRLELRRLGAKGRNGIGAVRSALALRDFAGGTSESPLEQSFLALILDAGLPAPVRQYGVQTKHGDFRLDFAYPDRMLAIELDGRTWHDRSESFQRDRTRQNALVALGWTILRYTSDDVRTRGAFVQSAVRDQLLDTGGFRPLPDK